MKFLKLFITIILAASWIIYIAYSAYNKYEIKRINNEGVVCLNKSRYSEAIKKFEQAYNRGNLSNDMKINILRNIAVAYEHNANFDKAIRTYNDAASKASPDSFMFNICNAEALMLEGDLKNATRYLNTAKTIKPDDFVPYNNLGLIYIGVYGEAFVDLNKALKNNLRAYELNGDTNTQFVLGKNLFLLKKHKQAEEHLVKIAIDVPDEPEFQYYLGLNQYYLGKETQGKKCLKRAVMISSVYNTEEVAKILSEEQGNTGL